MKLYKTFLIFVFFYLSLTSVAQESINYPSIDKKTYQQYLNKDWKDLIKTGKNSLKNNIDFYYLQVRMGIAYYELKKYANAVKYFEKAYLANKNDELIQEYLYFSYIFIGRYEDARVLSDKFKRNLKEKLKISAENPFIKALYLETKFDFNDDYKQLPQFGELIDQTSVLNKSYYNISLQHDIGSKTSIFHGYSNIGITNLIITDELVDVKTYEEKVFQNEYYFSLKYQIAKGTNISVGFHYLRTNYKASIPSSTSSGRWGNNSDISLYNYSENYFAASFNISKQFSIFNINAGASISNLNKAKQIQPIINVKLYPFGNKKLYTNSTIMYILGDDENSNLKHPILKQSIGIAFLKYSWFEPSITYGDMKNYTLYNVMIANNDINIVKQKYEALVNFGINKGKFNIFLKYEFNKKENHYTINHVDVNTQYINQAITGGIKWYFQKY